MAKFACERLLTFSFKKNELEFLLHHEEFLQCQENVKTLPDFEQLCLLGFELLEKNRKIEDLCGKADGKEKINRT